MPSQEIKPKNPLGASDEHMENFAAAFTKCFYAFMDRPDANERELCALSGLRGNQTQSSRDFMRGG